MRKIHIGLAFILVLILLWALVERREVSKLTEQLHKSESNYLTTVKNSTYLEDKIKSFQEKIDSITIKKDELFKVNKAKEEYIDTLEIKIREATNSISQLKDRLSKLEESLIGVEYQSIPGVQR